MQSFGQIIGILLDVVGPVFIIAAVGYGWARSGKTFDSSFVALVVNGISTPCLVLDTFTRAVTNRHTTKRMMRAIHLMTLGLQHLMWMR